MPDKNYYEILGVERSADRRAIRAAYRKALRRHHPDANAGSRTGEQLLRQVLSAGRVLSDPQQRARYDRQFTAAAPRRPPAPPQTRFCDSRRLKRLCRKILNRSARIWQVFFCAEQATATEMRAAHLRRPNPPEFKDYLYRAMSRQRASPYQRDADGICRRADRQSQTERLKTWPRRTALWILLGVMLWRG